MLWSCQKVGVSDTHVQNFLGFLDTNSGCAYDHDFAVGAALSRVSLSIRILVAKVATCHMAVMGKYDVVHKTEVHNIVICF